MSLAVMTSALMSALLLSAAPISVTVEPLGFSVRSDGEQVTVTRVKPGSVAAKAGLTPGMRIERIDEPRRKFSHGPIAQLNQEDLHDALVPPWDEPLVLQVMAGKKRQSKRLTRTDPRPAEEFPVVPLPPEQFDRLTYVQQARYSALLVSVMSRPPPLTLEQQSTAYVTQGALKAVAGGGFTPSWVYVRATLDARCQGSLEKVVLSGDAPGLPRTLPSQPGALLHEAHVTLDLPLWSPDAVTRACASRSSSLEVRLRGDVFCEGAPVQQRDLPVTLAVRCEQPLPPDMEDARNLLALPGQRRATGDTSPLQQLEVGAPGKLELGARLSGVIPLPSEATVVELDAQGEVARRLLTARVQEKEPEQRFHFVLDTKEPRTARLALALKFPDGSVQLSLPVDVTVVTAEVVAEQLRRRKVAREKQESFERKLRDAWKWKWGAPCDDPPSLVAWLKDQPEVEWASGTGTHFSGFYEVRYKVRGAPEPAKINCDKY